jgi:pimeloyl-ACP methyl ester carboxylesterase/AraC-like DNA-binding protein
MQIPETKYARSGDVNIAYQEIGDAHEYLIFVPGWVSNVEEIWNIPQLSAWLKYLSTFSKLVLFDKRGTGLSDRVSEHTLPTQEQRAEDLLAVMNTIGIKKAALLGLSEGGSLSLLFAFKYPNRVSYLILFGCFAKWVKTTDYPYGLTLEQHNKTKKHIFDNWGKSIGLHLMAPSVKNNSMAQNHWATFLRRSASPATAKVFYEMNTKIDVRSILPKIKVSTLIMHRRKDQLIESDQSQYLYEHIPHAQLIITEGSDHLPWFSVKREEIIAIETFLKGGQATVSKKLDILNVDDIFTLYSIRDYILNNFHESISLNTLSKQFGINVFKIKSGFKALFESSAINFLSCTRMEKACELLGEPKETVASIADHIGYKHANNFSLAFKRLYGITPQQYKFKIKNGRETAK